jgi:hypothetical protein
MEGEDTYISGLPTETELVITIEILNKRKFIDFDYLTYHRKYKIHEVSQILDGLLYEDDYLVHKLLMKCEKIFMYEGMNSKLMTLLESNNNYLTVGQ